jgi:hypothetical protein
MSSYLLDMYYVLDITTVCMLGPGNHLLSVASSIKQALAALP